MTAREETGRRAPIAAAGRPRSIPPGRNTHTMTTDPHADEDRRERYAKAIRDRVRIRLGANVVALAAQGRPLKMSFSEAEIAAEAAMAVADAELRRLADEPASAARVVSATPSHTDQAALREAIAAAIWARTPEAEPSRHGLVMGNPHGIADAVLAVLPPPADRAAVVADDEGDELVCVDQCGSCDACGMEPFGTPAEGWRQAAHFLRRAARESGDRAGALHGARLIEAELRRMADEPASAGLGVSATPSHTDQATVLLSEAERLMLRHALDLADANISARPDEYTAADEAALAALRRLADEAQQQEPGRSDVGTEFVRQTDQPDETGLAAFEADLGCQTGPKAAPKDGAAPESEPPVHGESVAHLAGLHDEPAVDARQDGAQR